MPIYEFQCTQHGLFEEIRPMRRSAEPATCPDCGESARRVLSVPRLAQLPRAVSSAHARNEKSQHSPEHRQGSKKLQDSANGHGNPNRHDGLAHRQGERQRLHTHPSSRPWVLEHG